MKTYTGKIKFLILSLLFVFLSFGCVKNPRINEPPSLIIPQNFDWKTIKDISCIVRVIPVSGIGDNMYRIIKIYSNSQMSDGSLVATGAATPSSPFSVKISLATSVPTIYVQEILPDGARNIKAVNVTGTSLDINFLYTISAEAPIFTKSSPVTLNVPVNIDSDADGVSAANDIDDHDPTVAFASYFPSASTWGTFAFEDLWPIKGDYDVNDLVIGFKISYFTNSSNLVTKLQVDYNTRASGSIYKLSAAFQLDRIAASNILSVSGQELNGLSPFDVGANGAENGVTLAVIPIFNNQKDLVSYSGYLNTVNGSYVASPDKSVSVRFVTPFSQSDIAMSAFNMFIVVNSRDHEIHLPTFAGTSKFNPSLANGYNLYPGDQFKNSDGMMWGIMIPVYFKYPSETNSIITAFTNFSLWATSGGSSHADWYSPEVGGNIKLEFIYQSQPEAVTIPTVSTESASDITAYTVTSGGNITSNGGTSVFSRGVCWGTSINPTISGSKTSNGSGNGSFVSYIIGLTPATTYYVRAYATNEKGTSYGDQKSFTTSAAPAPTYPGTSYSVVKIAGIWWAPVNAGYASDRLYGLLYQWSRMYGQRGSGDVGGNFSNAPAPVTVQEGNLLANADKFYQGQTDWCTVTLPTWDMTNYNPCPTGWRVPTSDEIIALINIGSTWVAAGSGGLDNLAGRWFGSDNAGARTNSTFLPAGGYRNISSTLSNRGVAGYYWPSNSESGENKNLYFTIDNPGQRFVRDRVNGYSVRCVRN